MQIKSPIRVISVYRRSAKLRFRGPASRLLSRIEGEDEGADDEATESGIRIGVSIWVAVGSLAVIGI
jgi:hypothetical protein